MKRVEISASFIVLWAVILFLDTEHICLYFLLAAAVHEFGHLFAIRICGAKILRFRLSALGGIIRYYLPAPSLLCEVFICINGCVFGSLLSCIAFQLNMSLLCGASTILTLFNLLPLSRLDGGRVLRLLLRDHSVLLLLEYFVLVLLLCTGVAAVFVWHAYGLMIIAVILMFLHQSDLHRRKNKGMI